MEKNRDWRDEYFSRSYYEFLARHLTPERTRKEVDFLEVVIPLKKNMLILDLGCGFGRHSIEMAKRGYKVIGVDRSLELLEIAKKTAREENLINLEFYPIEYKDLNQLTYSFDVVLSLYTSFGLHSYREDKITLREIYKILKPQGKLFIDIENREALLRHFIPYSWNIMDKFVLLSEHKFEPESGYYISRRIVYNRESGEVREFFRKIYLYTASELSNLLEEEGFKVLRFIGDYEGHKYSLASHRLIVLCMKRE
ncbi:MAG: methyltransferase domain-containing protein [Dictyoglomus sp.]|nr:methyltransferase domain-containing protein [Dictyoglomus sp.]MCX7844993.1 methyltransferase domain-containing protein [Dictyoglomaceae bacterium]MDW8187730.1 methyltransferase domain-containing protein [Dictyoglomus sp.]